MNTEEKKPSNPFAFPLEYKEYNSTGLLVERQEFGMTLKDHFAGLALQGIMASGHAVPVKQHQFDNIAEDSYRLADAMLKYREL